jgi:hypothetical protein
MTTRAKAKAKVQQQIPFGMTTKKQGKKRSWAFGEE